MTDRKCVKQIENASKMKMKKKVLKIIVKFDIFAWCHLETLKMIVKINSRFSPSMKKPEVVEANSSRNEEPLASVSFKSCKCIKICILRMRWKENFNKRKIFYETLFFLIHALHFRSHQNLCLQHRRSDWDEKIREAWILYA